MLKIVPFKNPSERIVFRVTGTICGRRFQRNFRILQEAERFMNDLNTAGNQGQSARPQVTTTTTITDDKDLRNAEDALERLREQMPKGRLTTAVDYYLANAVRAIKDADASQAVDQYLEHRKKRGNQKTTVSVAKSVL